MNRKFILLTTIILFHAGFILFMSTDKTTRRDSYSDQEVNKEVADTAASMSHGIKDRLKLLQDKKENRFGYETQPALTQETETTRPHFTDEGASVKPSMIVEKLPLPRKVVLIVSDFRSGSSLIGEVLNQNDDVFYMFEPLKDITINVVTAVENIINCRPLSFGRLRRNRQNGCGGDTTNCLQRIDMNQHCLKYPITAAKLIRLRSVQSIATLINTYSNLHIIHSFRDPRGTINSRLQFSDTIFYNGNAVSRTKINSDIIREISKSLCQRYLDDVNFGESLDRSYVRITYEDLIESPIDSIIKMYNLIDKQPPGKVLEWIKFHLGGTSDSGASDKMGLQRNGTETQNRWKHELSEEYICVIEEECYDLLELVGADFLCTP